MLNLIVIDYDNGIYELITQHDHALLAGEMASYSGKAPFGRSSTRTIITAALHDVSWKRSDRDFQKAPYHFVDYPLQEKLELYKTGIDQMESIDEYIALLTSIHYTAFFNPNGPEEVRHFLATEKQRQGRLHALFPNENIEFAHRQLQMWDNLSLYVCLNKPGVQKEEEHPWFQRGIRAVTSSGEHITIHGKWIDEKTVSFSPFPFTTSWEATIPYQVYDQTAQTIIRKERQITFIER